MSKRKIQFNLEKLLKKPEDYPYIQLNSNLFLKEIDNFRTKSFDKKVSKYDIRGQIKRMSDTIQTYSKKNNKSLKLINSLKSENDMLIEQLNNNIVKNRVFNQSVEQIFRDLIPIYKNRGYKIPDLSLKHNLFSINPLIIETRNDVNRFYENHDITKGDFIIDVENVDEKNFQYLKKLEKICFNYKKNSQLQNDKIKKKVREAEIERLDKFLKMEKEKVQKKENKVDYHQLKKDIDKIKLSLIELDKEKKRGEVKIEENCVFENLDFKKMLISKIKKIKFKRGSSSKADVVSNNSKTIASTINETNRLKYLGKSSKGIKQLLLTSIKNIEEKKRKKNKRNDILQNLYEKTYNTDFKKYNNIQDEVEDYFKYKYERPVSQMTIDNLPREMSNEINKIKLNANTYSVGENWKSLYNRIGKLDRITKISGNIENLDEHLKKIDYSYVKQTISNNFNKEH